MHFVVDKIVGRTGSGNWGQIHEFEKNGEKLVAVVSCNQSQLDDVQILTEGREIIARVHELYFGADNKLSVLEKLKKVLQKIVDEFEQVQLSVVVVKREVAYIGTYQGGVWMQMEGREGWIAEPEASTVRVFSGHLQPDLVLVVANPQFWSSVPFGTVKAVATSGSYEVLATLMHSSDSRPGAAVAIIRTVNESSVQVPRVVFGPQHWLGSLKAVVAKFVPKPSGPIYVSYEDKKGRRQRTLWMGIIFLVILVGLVIGWQVRRVYTDKDRLATLATIEQLQQQFSEGVALIPLNAQRSREILTEVKQGLSLLETNRLAQRDDRVKTMASQISDRLAEASGISTFKPELVLDLELVRAGMVGESMEFVDGDIMVLDVDQRRLVQVDPIKKSGSVIVGDTQLGSPQILASYPGRVAVFSDKGVVICTITQITCSVAVEPDGAWGRVADMAMFGGNIYLVSDLGIWRHQVTSEGGFGAKQVWLAEGESLPAQATSLAIDGFVWLGSPGGVVKYARGVKENFGVTSLDQPLSGDTKVYTTDELNNFYIFDSGNQRLVVFNKDGVYQKQFSGPEVSSLSDFLVDEKAGKLYILAGSKLWVGGL